MMSQSRSVGRLSVGRTHSNRSSVLRTPVILLSIVAAVFALSFQTLRSSKPEGEPLVSDKEQEPIREDAESPNDEEASVRDVTDHGLMKKLPLQENQRNRDALTLVAEKARAAQEAEEAQEAEAAEQRRAAEVAKAIEAARAAEARAVEEVGATEVAKATEETRTAKKTKAAKEANAAELPANDEVTSKREGLHQPAPFGAVNQHASMNQQESVNHESVNRHESVNKEATEIVNQHPICPFLENKVGEDVPSMDSTLSMDTHSTVDHLLTLGIGPELLDMGSVLVMVVVLLLLMAAGRRRVSKVQACHGHGRCCGTGCTAHLLQLPNA